MRIENKELFFRYACPCLEDRLGKKGKEIIEDFVKYGYIPPNLSKLFPTAFKRMEKIMKKMGKKIADEEDIKRYFFEVHNSHLKRLYESTSDRKLKEKAYSCMVKIGKVLNEKGEVYRVKIDSIGSREILCKSFLKNIKTGEKVVVHWNYIVDKVEK